MMRALYLIQSNISGFGITTAKYLDLMRCKAHFKRKILSAIGQTGINELKHKLRGVKV